MVAGRNDCRHRGWLSLAMAPPTMEPPVVARGGHKLEKEKNEMKNKEKKGKERGRREYEGKDGWSENGRKKIKRKMGKEMGRKWGWVGVVVGMRDRE